MILSPVLEKIRVVSSIEFKRDINYSFALRNLHCHGSLYDIMLDPEGSNPTSIGVASGQRDYIPFSIVSVTYNDEKTTKTMSAPCDKYTKPLKFPSLEIMAFTQAGFRRNGTVERILRKIVDRRKIQKDIQVYVYSQTMARICHRVGFTNVDNIHVYTD